jgi:hypothetical protein
MEAYKIEDRHGIILYDSMIAGVGDDANESAEEVEEDQEVEDTPENEENEENQDQTEPEEVETVEEAEEQEEEKPETGEEALQGKVEPHVRWSARVPVKQAVMDIKSKATKTYDTQLNQVDQSEIEYDLHGAKIFAMLIMY